MEEHNETVQLSEKEARKKRLRERRMARRAKRNARIARFRLLKNVFIWLLGVIFLPIAIVGVSFVVPISIITGSDGEYVSEDLSNKSLFEAVKFVAGNYSELGFSDFPIIGQKLADLENTDIGDGKTLGDVINIKVDDLNAIKFGDEGMADKVRDCVEVIATLDSVGGTDMLGDFGTLNVFNDAEEVGTLASIDTAAEDFDAKQYYYKTADDEYLRAFKDDGTFADGLSGSETVYYPPLAKVRISELVDIMDDAFGRLKITSLLDTFHASNETLIKVLGENTKVKDLADFDIKGVCLNDVMPKDSNNATLYDILEDLTENTYDVITIGDLSENFDTDSIKLTTVIPNNSNSETIYKVLSGALNKTAENITIGDLSSEGFDIKNVCLNDVMPKDSNNATLYDILEDLTENTYDVITIGDLSENFDTDSIKLTTVIPNNSNSEIIYKILSGALNKTVENIMIGDLSSENFDIDKVLLSDVLTLDDDMYDLLCDAVEIGEGDTKPTKTTITIGHLSHIDIDLVPLDTVITLDEESTLNKVLKAAVNGTGTDGAILLGDLTNFDINSVPLDTVLTLEENSTLNKVLKAAVNGTGTAGAILLGDLISGFDIDKVALNTVLTLDENGILNKILKAAVNGTGTDGAILLGDLTTGFDIDSVPLDTVLTLDENDTLNKILKAAVNGTGTDGAILLGDLTTGFDIDSVPLDTVLTLDENDTLNKILKAAVNGTGTDGAILLGDLTTGFDIDSVPLDTVLTLDENSTLNKILKAAVNGTGTDGAILLRDLTTGFDIDSVPLDTVLTLDENSTLNKILKAAVSGTGTDGAILLGDLTTGFDINSVPLNTVLEGVDLTDNNVLLALKEQNDGEGILISEIGSALNNLSLYEVYGKTAFTTTPIDGARRFTRVDDESGKPLYYNYDEDGEYYLNNSTGIWLILCFDTAEYEGDTVKTRYSDDNGNPIRYIVADMKIKDLQSGSGFSRKFKNATLKQLIDTGLVDGVDNLGDKTKAMSLQRLIEILASDNVQAYIEAMENND